MTNDAAVLALPLVSARHLEILPPEEQEQSLQTTPSSNPAFCSSSSSLVHQSQTIPLQLVGGRILEISVDAEDDDFSREAKINAALEAAAEAEKATLEAMELQSSLSSTTTLALVVAPPPLLAEKRPRSPSSSPSREDSHRREKMPARAASPSVEVSMLETTTEGVEEEEGESRSPSVPPSHRPTAEAAANQLRRLLEEFRFSLAPQVQSCSSATPAHPLLPSIQAFASVILTACQGMEASLMHLCSPETNPSASPPAPGPSPLRMDVFGPGRASESLGTHLPSPFPALKTTTPPSPGPKETSWATVVSRKARHGHRVVTSMTDSSSPNPTGSRGSKPQSGSPGANGPSSPVPPSTRLGRAREASTTSPRTQPRRPPPVLVQRRGLRAMLPTPTLSPGAPLPPPSTEAIEALLFAATPTAHAAMETEGAAAAPSAGLKAEEPVTYLHVACPTFSAAARKEPREAWRLLLLSKSKEGTPRLRPLDILPVSSTAAEIFLLESQLPVFREALQQFLVETPPPLTEAGDFRRRATAYRNSYFRSYRKATLLGFSPELQAELLWILWNEVLNPAGPPKSKYKDLRRVVQGDLQDLQLLSPSRDH